MKVINFEDGHCKRIRSYLDSYLNNELMVETNHEVLTHLETCEPCSRSLEDRARLKAQLKRAVTQEYAPPALRERIVSDLRRRRGFNFRNLSLAAAAAVAVAAMLVIAAATLFTSNAGKKPPLSLRAEVAQGDVTGQILKIGFDDHVSCSIDHQMANKQFTAEQMSERLGSEYSGLVALVKNRMPADYTVAVGHRCHYQGREFVHLIVRNQKHCWHLACPSRRHRGTRFRWQEWRLATTWSTSSQTSHSKVTSALRRTWRQRLAIF